MKGPPVFVGDFRQGAANSVLQRRWLAMVERRTGNIYLSVGDLVC